MSKLCSLVRKNTHEKTQHTNGLARQNNCPTFYVFREQFSTFLGQFRGIKDPFSCVYGAHPAKVYRVGGRSTTNIVESLANKGGPSSFAVAHAIAKTREVCSCPLALPLLSSSYRRGVSYFWSTLPSLKTNSGLSTL